ncbi:putative cytochrome p450 [Annulohypoxylon maeteangense]|uniref:putative cytochrome p450 n=1 Tax=Annulohypoxylon maeteangense TaxID=1927788 RepID=UPI002008B536|nr:putative cytochrome p450 [Annulohypoxylon maeteangense]KAI0885806.1 putative cytochrome p450 [Annulohypoxylon maeteangense]
MIQLIVFSLITLFTWRVWRFTVSPMLNPSHPKEFPSWVPCHAAAFFCNSNGLLASARKYFNTNEPFALTVLGMTFYVVTQAKHSAEVYKSTDTLSFEDFVQGLMRTNGNDLDVIKVMYSPLSIDKAGFPNPQGDSLGVLAQKMHIHQLHPGQNLLVLQKRVQTWIHGHLSLRVLHDTCTYASPKGLASIELPLYQWCSEYFVRLGQQVYFGEILDKIDPGLPSAFLEFDELIWKMLYQYPSFLSHDMSKPRSRIIASLNRYFRIPRSQREDGAAWLINTMEDEAKSLGIDDDNLAVLVFHLYFAINTNTRKTVFWVLTYLVHNPSLMRAFREETGPAFDGHNLVDPFYIQDPVNCPQVDAIWHETLRLSGWSASVRLINQDTVIGGKLMRKGNRVLVPHRLLHFDESIFGQNIYAFHPERWQKENLTRSPSWRPFGGGKTMCSGRFLARFSVTTFVATLLRRFDIEKVGNSPFPQADQGRPVLGIMSIKEGHDFNVKLTPREAVR